MPDSNQSRVLLGILLLGSSGLVFAEELLRDPTRPFSARAERATSTPPFTVNAIFTSSKRRIAIVNGQRVAIGEQVDGATVVSIAKNQLTLEFNGKSITAKLTYGAID